MKTYLSIDLDFWCDEKSSRPATCFFRRLFRKVEVPIMVALHHHHLVHHINNFKGLDTLFNLDYHSDLSDDVDGDVMYEEGTWVNFVSFRPRGTYIWRYPYKVCLDSHTGYCHRGRNPFEEQCSSWARAKMKKGLAGIPWKSICGVGVSLSPDWLLGNQKAVNYPIKMLGLHEWIGRWWACTGIPASACPEMRNGTGIFQPYLKFMRGVV